MCLWNMRWSFHRIVPLSIMILSMTLWIHVRPRDPSSTLLRMHRFYTLFPPHDTSLYDALHVLPNATSAQITKQYRKLTRQLHPDKIHHRAAANQYWTQNQTGHGKDHDNNTTRIMDEYQHKLFQVRSAYEVLKQDITRLPYHRYGLLDTASAAAILTGGKLGHFSHLSPLQLRLLEWMGYSNQTMHLDTWTHDQDTEHPDNHRRRHSARVLFLAIHLVERIRPLVEGVLSQEYLIQEVAKECDTLKTLPLGAHILRCIGRAYRLCGQRYLRRHGRTPFQSSWGPTTTTRNNKRHIPPIHVATVDLTDSIQLKFRNVKSLASAAMASGRLILEESVYSWKQRQNRGKNTCIPYPDLGNMEGLDDPDIRYDRNDEYDVIQTEEERAHQAMISSLQVEALWKIAKIDLDKTVQEACNVVLRGEYFFFPSHQSSWDYPCDLQIPMTEGWVSSSGKAVDVSIGKLRAAAAMILVGDVMVRSSKDGTSWVD